MLDRTMGILSQSVNIWPLAQRWMDSIKKLIAADKKNLNIMSNSHESGMAEGVGFHPFLVLFFCALLLIFQVVSDTHSERPNSVRSPPSTYLFSSIGPVEHTVRRSPAVSETARPRQPTRSVGQSQY